MSEAARRRELDLRLRRPMALEIDLEPLVDQVVARLRTLPAADGDARLLSKRAYRTPEAAEILSLSDSTVRELVAAGELDSIKVGAVRLVPASAIEAFIARKLAEHG